MQLYQLTLEDHYLSHQTWAEDIRQIVKTNDYGSDAETGCDNHDSLHVYYGLLTAPFEKLLFFLLTGI